MTRQYMYWVFQVHTLYLKFYQKEIPSTFSTKVASTPLLSVSFHFVFYILYFIGVIYMDLLFNRGK